MCLTRLDLHFLKIMVWRDSSRNHSRATQNLDFCPYRAIDSFPGPLLPLRDMDILWGRGPPAGKLDAAIGNCFIVHEFYLGILAGLSHFKRPGPNVLHDFSRLAWIREFWISVRMRLLDFLRRSRDFWFVCGSAAAGWLIFGARHPGNALWTRQCPVDSRKENHGQAAESSRIMARTRRRAGERSASWAHPES